MFKFSRRTTQNDKAIVPLCRENQQAAGLVERLPQCPRCVDSCDICSRNCWLRSTHQHAHRWAFLVLIKGCMCCAPVHTHDPSMSPIWAVISALYVFLIARFPDDQLKWKEAAPLRSKLKRLMFTVWNRQAEPWGVCVTSPLCLTYNLPKEVVSQTCCTAQLSDMTPTPLIASNISLCIVAENGMLQYVSVETSKN